MRFLTILFGFSFLVIVGCADRAEVGPETYGTVVQRLPSLEAAEAPFPFPYAGETDHSQCVFSEEEDFF